MATFDQINEAFNANFSQKSGPRKHAQLEALGQGNYRATFDGQKIEFPVKDDATLMQLMGTMRDPALRLWEAVQKRRG